MHTVTSESLLDESDFLAELSSLERGLPEKPPSVSAVLELPEPARITSPGKFWDHPLPAPAAPVEDDDAPFLGRLATAGMFVLMMGVGAAGAALLYHERVARILASLRI